MRGRGTFIPGEDEFNFRLRKLKGVQMAGGLTGGRRRGREIGREGRSAKLKVSKARSYLTNVLPGKETNERRKKKMKFEFFLRRKERK